MTPTEGRDLLRLLSWILGAPVPGEGPVNDAEAMEAAAMLADQARRVLGSGPDGQEVRALWCQVRPVVTVDQVPYDSGGTLPSGVRLVRNTGPAEPMVRLAMEGGSDV